VQIERRTYVNPIELTERSVENTDNIGVLGGYIARFNSDSEDLGGFIERIMPGAFADSLASRDVVALIGHDHTVVVGRLSAGTLRLQEDALGLRYEIDLPDTTAARDLKTLVQRGDLVGNSFGFTFGPEDAEVSKRGKQTIVTLKRVNLIEVSVGVAFPAYTATSSSMVRMVERFDSVEDVERQRAKARLRLLEI